MLIQENNIKSLYLDENQQIKQADEIFLSLYNEFSRMEQINYFCLFLKYTIYQVFVHMQQIKINCKQWNNIMKFVQQQVFQIHQQIEDFFNKGYFSIFGNYNLIWEDIKIILSQIENLAAKNNFGSFNFKFFLKQLKITNQIYSQIKPQIKVYLYSQLPLINKMEQSSSKCIDEISFIFLGIYFFQEIQEEIEIKYMSFPTSLILVYLQDFTLKIEGNTFSEQYINIISEIIDPNSNKLIQVRDIERFFQEFYSDIYSRNQFQNETLQIPRLTFSTKRQCSISIYDENQKKPSNITFEISSEKFITIIGLKTLEQKNKKNNQLNMIEIDEANIQIFQFQLKNSLNQQLISRNQLAIFHNGFSFAIICIGKNPTFQLIQKNNQKVILKDGSLIQFGNLLCYHVKILNFEQSNSKKQLPSILDKLQQKRKNELKLLKCKEYVTFPEIDFYYTILLNQSNPQIQQLPLKQNKELFQNLEQNDNQQIENNISISTISAYSSDQEVNFQNSSEIQIILLNTKQENNLNKFNQPEIVRFGFVGSQCNVQLSKELGNKDSKKNKEIIGTIQFDSNLKQWVFENSQKLSNIKIGLSLKTYAQFLDGFPSDPLSIKNQEQFFFVQNIFFSLILNT